MSNNQKEEIKKKKIALKCIQVISNTEWVDNDTEYKKEKRERENLYNQVI